MKRYAQVIVDISSEQVDRLFTYRVPEDMPVAPGQRVRIPFGPRHIEGYVLSLTDETELDADVIKPISGTIEDKPVILPELIDLAEWMKERYHCNLVDGLRQMIPAQMRGGRIKEKRVDVARLTAVGEALEKAERDNARAPKRLEVLHLLIEGPKPVALLNQICAGGAKALEKQGIVEISSQEISRRPYQALSGEKKADPPLMREQAAALQALTEAMHGSGGRFLLHGVTGSGKTEVYIRLVREALKNGGSAIVLVPEISLTPQMVDWFRARFGGDAAVIHSRLSAGERYDEWRRIHAGEARVVVGARSAVFAPMESPSVIIVDEEHESTYQSESRPRYDAREVAAWRMAKSGGVLLLGSATPSMSSYMRTMPGVRPQNRLTLLEMTERVAGRPLPEVEIVDMREELIQGNKSMFSGALLSRMRECLEAGHQAILFLNRRGHSTFVSCRACGHVEKCAQCDVSLTYHLAENAMRCHYCGEERKPPAVCPECGSRYIRYFGVGTQKVEEEFQKLFPGVPTLRMDFDTTSGKDSHEKLLSSFRKGEARVMIGTQMIAKGLDFPNVTLVGVVAADLSLHTSDYRGAERTFQLLTQVAGRAGRAQYAGHVVVQTYDPEHYGIQLAAKQDFRAFYVAEEKKRRRGLYPPFTVMARLLVSAREEETASRIAQGLGERLDAFLESEAELRRDVVQMRAMEAPMKQLRGEFRWQVFIKMYARPTADAVIAQMETLEKLDAQGARVELEVNPAAML